VIKAEFSASLFQSSVLHDPSGIILIILLMMICCSRNVFDAVKPDELVKLKTFEETDCLKSLRKPIALNHLSLLTQTI